MHFVDDVNLVAASRRADGDVLPQLADLVDAAIARGVDLDHIDVLASRDRPTGVALVARLRRGPLLAGERLGVDPSRARLADAAGPGKEIRVPDPPRLDGPRETAGHVFLADEIGEELRTVASRDDLVSAEFSHGSHSQQAPITGHPGGR